MGLADLNSTTFRIILAGWLTIADLQALRLVCKHLHSVVDELLPIKLAFQSYHQLLDNRNDQAMLYHVQSPAMWWDRTACRKLFSKYAGHGALPIIQAIEGKYHLDGKEVLIRTIAGEADEVAFNGFQLACRNGRLDVAQWIVKHYDLNQSEAMYCDSLALAMACKFGHLHIAQWLTAHYALTHKHATGRDNLAKRSSSSNGHLEIVQWLASEFQTTAEDAKACECQSFRKCCGNEHLDTAKWMTEYYNLTDDDARSCGNDAFVSACGKGHVAVVNWLTSRFRLDIDDVRTDECVALCVAAENGYYEMVVWLTTHFALDYNDGRTHNNRAFVKACGNGHLNVAQVHKRAYTHVMMIVVVVVMMVVVVWDAYTPIVRLSKHVVMGISTLHKFASARTHT